jgi:SAM-dependent methyltransferase
MHPDHELNRSSWNELAAVHGQDAYYDSEAHAAGANSLIEEEEAALFEAIGPDLTGRRVLHLQCHLGFDAITFARRGASVTGVDFSAVALAKARLLARRCGVDVEWICADATALPDALDRKFDLTWATMGIHCWIADIRAWMRCVATALAPGGKLILIDGHPGGPARKSDDAPINRLESPRLRRYLETGCDYATPTRTGPQVQFRYPLAEVVAAAENAGLRVNQLLEYTATSDGLCIENLRREADGRYRHRVDGEARPVLFSLTAAHAGGDVENACPASTSQYRRH